MEDKMSKKEERIEEEIRRRAFDRMNEREEARKQQVRQEANLEALESVAELPREELERIDQEVRTEFITRQKKIKTFLTAVTVIIIIVLASVFFKVRQPGPDGAGDSTLPLQKKAPAAAIPPSPTTPLPPQAQAPAVPEQTGPILTKAEAERVLKEPLLECLRESGRYAMIVRIGQGYKAATEGPLPPLQIFNNEATIDYRSVKNFTGTPLGECVANAALGVRTRAFKGNYMRFAVTNPEVADPLAHASKTIDQKAAQQALSKFDEEARECVVRYPQYAEPGKTISFSINFRGVDGTVTEVLPFYVKDSPYRSCLEESYQKAMVPPFRRLHTKVIHKLAP